MWYHLLERCLHLSGDRALNECKTHPHSSPETARACHAARLGKWADRTIERSGAHLVMPRYGQVKFDPPVVVRKPGFVPVTYFYYAVKVA